jgi:hypothetical protein
MAHRSSCVSTNQAELPSPVHRGALAPDVECGQQVRRYTVELGLEAVTESRGLVRVVAQEERESSPSVRGRRGRRRRRVVHDADQIEGFAHTVAVGSSLREQVGRRLRAGQPRVHELGAGGQVDGERAVEDARRIRRSDAAARKGHRELVEGVVDDVLLKWTQPLSLPPQFRYCE